MIDDTLIADLVRAGMPAELIGRVAQAIAMASAQGAAVSADIHGQSTDILAKRRERDRLRQQKKREFSRKNKGASKANDVDVAPASFIGPSTDSREKCCDSFFLSSSESQQPEKKKEVVTRARGTRVTAEWRPEVVDQQFAHGLGLDPQEIVAGTAEFIDYWIAVPGQRGCKLDWSATWRNRMRELKGRRRRNSGHGKRSLSDVADDLIARAEGRERATDFGAADGGGPVIEGSTNPRR